MKVFGDVYRGRRVLVTGHTGFKGSWLTTWLNQMGAEVIGYSLAPPTTPSMFETLRLKDHCRSIDGDVRDPVCLYNVVAEHKPSIVFHLAGQALMGRALEDPVGTLGTNACGTANLLDAAMRVESVQAVVCVTSDKCYSNQEWGWGYREVDPLGPHNEPYGLSKAMAEIIIDMFSSEKFQRAAYPNLVRLPAIASARAGNVIGGGDWARGRLIPDIVRAILAKRDVVLRNPQSTRPWQHVLEALSGYLRLGQLLLAGADVATPYNFGPSGPCLPSDTLAHRLVAGWPGASEHTRVVQEPRPGVESGLLQLDVSKAQHELGWSTTWSMDETIQRVVDWYTWEPFGKRSPDPRWQHAMTVTQIDQYCQAAMLSCLPWATGVE